MYASSFLDSELSVDVDDQRQTAHSFGVMTSKGSCRGGTLSILSEPGNELQTKARASGILNTALL